MENLDLELLDVKDLFNYVSEAIIISDKNHNIVAVNDIGVKKLGLEKEQILLKKLNRNYYELSKNE